MNAPGCRLLLAALCAGACLLRVAPWFAARLHDGNDEPLGIVPLAAALCFFWRERRTLPEITAVRLALVFTGTAAVFVLPLPPMLRALAALGVLTVAAQVRQPAIIGLLSLSLPVMASLQFYAGYPLRWLTASGFQRGKDSRLLHQPSSERRIERRQTDGAVLDHLDQSPPGTE